jgi:hypothetical protein
MPAQQCRAAVLTAYQEPLQLREYPISAELWSQIFTRSMASCRVKHLDPGLRWSRSRRATRHIDVTSADERFFTS